MSQPAFAQVTAEESAESGDREIIIVTGSRIGRNTNLESTVPVTSVSAEELLDNGNLSLGDALNQLPAMRSTFSQANSTRFIGTAGLNLLDLRGLGTTRTLVLVNGRRHITSTPGAFDVDVNTIPTDLLQRVDVITGGNSAIYGSDAVSGVVNFILRDDFDGIRIRGQGGISSRQDRGSYFISGIAGKNFADGRGNITGAIEYSRSNPLYFSDRPNQTGAFTGPPGFATVDVDIQCALDANGNPIPGSVPFCDPNVRRGSDGIPDTAFRNPGPAFGIISLGGTVNTVCPAPTATNAAQIAAVCTGQLSPTGGRLSHNYVFLPDGTLVRDPVTEDLRNVGGGRYGGLTASGVEGAMLLPGLERVSGSLMAKYEVSPAVVPFIEGKFVRITANQTSTQPTFVNSTLSPVFSINNPFLTQQARDTISLITGGASTFTMFRFNNDIGTRAEDHERETWRIVGGVRGRFGSNENWSYEVAANYGRTETYYETGGNVLVANFNRATNAVRNAAGQIVCAVNANASTADDDPACVPLNLFGLGAPSQAALDYVLHTSSREERASQLQLTAFISGNTAGFFELPGGPIGVALGVEYRRERAYTDYDDVTQSGATFLNAFDTFDPPTYSVKELFGEIRIPILADVPFFNELSIEGAARVSDYNFANKAVWAYNAGVVWSPIPDIRFRGGYSRSVRAPNLNNLYATRAQTFANNFQDPCDQRFINNNENRAARCAEAGIPTTITLPDGREVPWTNALPSGLSGFNQGNSNLTPEKSDSYTVGAVIQPRFLPGFTLTVDYYDITIKQAIAGLTGQAIVNRCYEDPVSLNNVFCDAVFRRTSADPYVNFTFDGQSGRRFDGFPDIILPVLGPGFLNQPFNFQSLKTSGIDFDMSYRRNIGDVTLSARAIVSYLINREQFVYISDPARSDRLHGVLGDPEWSGQFSLRAEVKNFDFGYSLRFLDRMTIGAWETQFSHQGRLPQNEDAFPVTHYPRVFYHDIRAGVRANDRFRIYAGVDNVFDKLPPYGATGTGAANGIYSVTGRFFYAGAEVNF
ncbi:MAG TPA: TonB-dependent receptor [Sphingopyxis sp.]|nr:TonB-dependent receptor [Sphingopyxis sp.]HMP44081.1 TonB-dependent receptor [Sphingopyxis sp.]HMQ18789.1 TonB-dependent receptor [Sphingopyxis sp.]